MRALGGLLFLSRVVSGAQCCDLSSECVADGVRKVMYRSLRDFV